MAITTTIIMTIITVKFIINQCLRRISRIQCMHHQLPGLSSLWLHLSIAMKMSITAVAR